MTTAIRLIDHGIRLFTGRLYNHDYLWFSSHEISKVSTTLPFVHNYALCYALSQRSYGVFMGSTPKYVEDPDGEFGSMDVYATPAFASNYDSTTITSNSLDDLSLTTGDSKSSNSPTLGKRVYINLGWDGRYVNRPQLGFQCYVYTFNNFCLPHVFRLGKKGTPVRARWEEINCPIATFKSEGTRPTHVLNPLDVNGVVTSYDPVAIPPHLLFRTATVRGEWFVISDVHRVQVPKRVLRRTGFQP